MDSGWNTKPTGWEETHEKYKIKHNFNKINFDTKNTDVIIVMAGGLDDNGNIHPWVKKRLDVALDLYRQNPKFILCTGGGTYHKPPILNKENFVIHESTACADYLISNDVNPQHIIKEWASYDSVASVYFSLLLCVIPRNWNNICVITSDFHMTRVKMLFEWIFKLHSNKYNFTFLNAINNMPTDILALRTKREKNSVNSLKNVITKINSLESFNKWLYTEHKAYSCSHIQKRDVISKELQKSY